MSLGRARNHGCRISDAWHVNGLRTLLLENELLRVTVLVDRGSDIIEFRYKPLDLDFMYFSPAGIRNPNRGVPSAFTDSPFLDYYLGGWNDILPSGGPLTLYKGAALGQHAEISLIPWEYAIDLDTPEQVRARLWVRPLRTPFFVEKTLSLEPGHAALHIHERVTNEGGEPLHLMWGQHIAFGRPFLEEGAVIDAPAKRFIAHAAIDGYEPRRFQPGAESAWPTPLSPAGEVVDAGRVPAYGAEKAQELGYLAELTEGWYAITNQARQVGFGLSFDPRRFRYIWLWQQLGDVAGGFPWWARTHTVALEPWTSYPTNGLNEAIANGTAVPLAAGESLETSLCAVAYTGLARVSGVNARGQVTGTPA
ncbi:MAG: DUF4432 family protein [Anaerolineales bacterium]|nr:DUF4432 family protein [Anaerolineales bacterium]